MTKHYDVSDSQCVKIQKAYRNKQIVYNKWVEENKNIKKEPKNSFWKKLLNFFCKIKTF